MYKVVYVCRLADLFFFVLISVLISLIESSDFTYVCAFAERTPGGKKRKRQKQTAEESNAVDQEVSWALADAVTLDREASVKKSKQKHKKKQKAKLQDESPAERKMREAHIRSVVNKICLLRWDANPVVMVQTSLLLRVFVCFMVSLHRLVFFSLLFL